MEATGRMEPLIYFIIWAAVFFLMLRFGCGAQVMGYGHGRRRSGGGSADNSADHDALRWVPPARDIDPVCKTSVATSTAKPSVHDGAVFYFCSRECREIFEAAPEQYVGRSASEQPSELEKFHA